MTVVRMSLDQSSIQKAVNKLEEYRREGLQKKIDRTMTDIVNRLMEKANAAYATALVSLTAEKIGKNVWMVTASSEGSSLVAFLEFGTGFKTDSSHPYAGNVPFAVYEGSWSEQHAGTYEKWIAAGNDPEKYPYNHLPRRGLYVGMQAARDYLHRMSARVR